MKLNVFCVKCFPLCPKHRPEKYYQLNIQDSQVYSLRCEHGHETTVGMQQSKFELLYELGCHAAADGYYREAISSFAASLERFYEIVIKAILCETNATEQKIDEMWKEMKSSSERQLGAYLSLYTNKFGHCPKLLHPNLVKLRNNATHKGYIPSKNEMIEYGQSVLDLIYSHEEAMRGVVEKGIDTALMNEHCKSVKGLDMMNGYQSSIPTLIVFSVRQDPPRQQRSLEAHVRLLEEIRELTTIEMPPPPGSKPTGYRAG